MLAKLKTQKYALLMSDNVAYAEHKPEIVKVNDDGTIMIRHFLISDKHYNTQNWETEGLTENLDTFKKMPVILAPGYHHIVGESYDEWLKLQAPYAIGSIDDIVLNKEYGCYDAISNITDVAVAKEMRAGNIPPYFSPGINIDEYRIENRDGKKIKILTKWRGVHSAIVGYPAFRPVEMARINKEACAGDKELCRMRLAAIAEDKNYNYNPAELIKNFSTYIDESRESKTMSENDGGGYKDLNARLQADIMEKQKALDIALEKNKSLETSQEQIKKDLAKLTEDNNTFKSKLSDYETQAQRAKLKAELEDKLKTVDIFIKDAELRNKKAEEFAAKGWTVADVESIYEKQILTEDQIKAMTDNDKIQTVNIGIGEDKNVNIRTSLQAGPPRKNRSLEGVETLADIWELRF